MPIGARLTTIDKWHLTLVFLGDVPDDRVGTVASILGGIRPAGPITLRLSGGGRFGAAAWAGLDGAVDALGELRERIRDALTEGGFGSDERPFRPHLTVSYHAGEPVLRSLSAYAGASWPVTETVLVRSAPGRYERLAAWPVPLET